MKQLNQNWITEGLMDFEYKKYILLSWLQTVEQDFNETKLYPSLRELLLHHRNLVSIRDQKESLAGNFQKQLTKIDFEKLRLQYSKMTDDELMRELDDILDYAIPMLGSRLREGTDLYEFVEHEMTIEPVGVVPLNAEVGYIFLRAKEEKTVRAYSYEITLFESAQEKYRGLKMNFVQTYPVSITMNYPHMKSELIKLFPALPNPGTFAIESNLVFPLPETLLPVAKRTFVRYLVKEISR